MRRALYILSELDEHDVRWMAETGRRTKVAAGEVLISSGKAIETLYLLIAGELEVVGRNGHQIAKLAVGDIVGEMSLIEKRPPSVSVRAIGAAQVLALPHAVIRARLEGDPAFAARFYRALAVFLSDRLRATVARLGYDGGSEAKESDDTSAVQDRFADEHELDEGLLDTLHLAGDRMRRLLALLEGGRQ